MQPIDPGRATVADALLRVLYSRPRKGRIQYIEDGAREAICWDWPAPAGLFEVSAVPHLVPDPPVPPVADNKKAKAEKELDPAVIARDFSQVNWPGVGRFLLNPKQAAVVRELYESFMDGHGDVKESYLVEVARRAGSDATRLRDVFRHCPAWGVLVVPGDQGGFYRLPPLPEDDEV